MRGVLEGSRAQRDARGAKYWQPYYRDPTSQALELQYSLSDRIRYYWTLPTCSERPRDAARGLAPARYSPDTAQPVPARTVRSRARRLTQERPPGAAAGRRCPGPVRVCPGMPPGCCRDIHMLGTEDRQMDVFGLSAEQIDSAGAHWTAREICQQPQIWLDVERLMAAEADRLHRFLAPLLAQPDLRIVLTGAGTSSFVGQCLAPAMAARTAGAWKPSRRRTWSQAPRAGCREARLRCWCPSRDRATAPRASRHWNWRTSTWSTAPTSS